LPKRSLMILTLIFGFLLPVIGEGCWASSAWIPSFINVYLLLLSSLSLYFLLIVFPLLCAGWYFAGCESKKSFYLEAFLWGVFALILVVSTVMTPFIISYEPR
jgi:hypothetical protein